MPAQSRLVRFAAASLVLIFVGLAVAVWPGQEGGASTAAADIVTVRRGNVVVTVGGVGKIVEGGVTPGQTSLAAGASATTSTGTAPRPAGATSIPADAVLPRASGRLVRLLVKPGQHVATGEAVAVLDDGGALAAAALQARNDLATANLELAQKRTFDPLRGFPPTAAELAGGRLAVISARARLARLSTPRPADVSTARADVRRTIADLQALRGGPPEVRSSTLANAQRGVQVAQARVDRLVAGPTPADVAAAEADVKKAEADLEALVRNDRTLPVTQAEIDAAKATIAAARQRLARVIAGPDPADVAAAQLELARAQAEVQRIAAGPGASALAAAEQAVSAARARLAQLLGKPLRSDLLAARLDVRKAVADLAVLHTRGRPASHFDVGLGRLKVDAAAARLALANDNETQLTVRTPFAGTVTGVLTAPGAPVDPATPVVTVADLRDLAASVDLSEFDVAKVRRGQPADVSVDALGGKRFTGRVLFEALVGVDNGGVVTFPLQIGLSHVRDVKPGMNVSVRIVVASRRNVLELPLEAVSQTESGRSTVTVVDAKGSASERRVELGLSNNKSVEIISGVRSGDQVQLAGSQGG